MIQGKVWGRTEEIFSDGKSVSIHRLGIRAGGYCSEHSHFYKSNIFFILRGRLEIRQWPEGREIPDTTVLQSGELTEIPSGIWHQFRAIEDTECLEIYSGRIDGDDIQRRTTGGLR